jgi:outer membrane protein assembly factor BamD
LAATGLLLAMTGVACASRRSVVPTGMLEADRYLFERATELIAKKKWLVGRQFLLQLIDSYPQSAFRPDAKLGLGDSYIGDGTPESMVLAQNEFKEFLTFYPTHRRADYAQYRLGVAHYLQMLSPDRDQTETKEAVAEFASFVQRYPNSALLKEAQAKMRSSRDRLGLYEFRVGQFYFRSRWYPGAVDRLRALLASDPEFTYRDAAYFYLAESLVKMNLQAAALPYYEKIIEEFEKSEYLLRARQAIDLLKSGKPPGPKPPVKK